MQSGRSKAEIGREAERLAEAHLDAHGLKLLTRNYRCRGGELDLVMRDGASLVFVEVRYRKHQTFGGAAASVDWHKQQRLIHAAQHYMQRYYRSERPCRFDIIAVSPGDDGKAALQWIKNAIELD